MMNFSWSIASNVYFEWDDEVSSWNVMDENKVELKWRSWNVWGCILWDEKWKKFVVVWKCIFWVFEKNLSHLKKLGKIIYSKYKVFIAKHNNKTS